MLRLLLSLCALATLLASPVAAQSFPELTGRVVDEANIIPAEVEAQLEQKLAALEEQSQRQLVVATIADLEGYDIADYGYRLGRAWELGDAERDDGAILLVAPNQRQTRIEVGYGLEGILTDALSSIIIQNEILPRFRDGDLAAGIVAGTDALVRQLQLPEEEARAVAEAATQERASEGGFPIGTIIWIVFIILFFVVPMFSGGKRRRYRGGGMGGFARDIILWEAGKAVARGLSDSGSSGWGGGGFGGGGFGGGGFGGGGGSFGGGGASGGW